MQTTPYIVTNDEIDLAVILPHYADFGFDSSDLAIVDRSSMTGAVRDRVERQLLAHARSAADDGRFANQDRSVRAGISIEEDGAIIATFRHEGQHVCTLVGIDARLAPEELRVRSAIAARLARLELRLARLNAWRNRVIRSSRTSVCSGRKVRAANIPGTPEHGEVCMLGYEITRVRLEISDCRANGGAN